jgi:hypothetical protein
MNYLTLPVRQFGDTYNCGAYGADQYNSAQVCGASTSSSTGGNLADTGLPLDLIGGVAILIVTASFAIKMALARKKKTALPTSSTPGL